MFGTKLDILDILYHQLGTENGAVVSQFSVNLIPLLIDTGCLFFSLWYQKLNGIEVVLIWKPLLHLAGSNRKIAKVSFFKKKFWEVRSRECSVESDPGFSVLFLCKFNINVNWFLWQNVASTKNRGSVTSLQHKSKNTLYPFGPTKVQNDHFDSFGRSKHPYTRYSVCDFSAKDRTEDRTIFHLLQTNRNCSIIMTPPLCSFIRRDESPP